MSGCLRRVHLLVVRYLGSGLFQLRITSPSIALDPSVLARKRKKFAGRSDDEHASSASAPGIKGARKAATSSDPPAQNSSRASRNV